MPNPTILISSVGYKTERLQLKSGNLKPVTIRLIVEIKELDAIVVKPDRKRYKNRNNPAMDVMEKVISNKSNNRIIPDLDYSYEKYDKILFGLSNLTPELKERRSKGKYQFVFENTDTSLLQGKEVLSVYLKETMSDVVYQNATNKENEITKADMSVNKDINLNWVKQASIIQEFENAPDFGWHITRNEIKIDFGKANNGMGMLGQRTAFYRHYSFDTIKTMDSVRAIPANEYRKADTKTDEYWEQNRPFDLTASERHTCAE